MLSLTTGQLWSQILDYIQENEIFDSSTFSSYIKDAVLYSVNEDFVIIQVPYKTSKEFFIGFKDEFENIFKHFLERDVKCKVVLEKDIVNELENENDLLREARMKNKVIDDNTFDNFIEGKSNMKAFNACMAFINFENTAGLNPLFIYGNSGLGKTHLLHSICNELKEHHPDMKYLYIDGNYLIEMIIHSLRKEKNSRQLIDQMCELDFLLIDDIQHLSKTNDSQELFFNIYNSLISKGKRIVLTSDVYPTELSSINNRIISRFTSGLTVGIDPPEFETAVSILYKKLEGREQENIINEDALYYIARKFNHDVRTLEGKLNELLFNAILFNPPIIDEEFAINCFKNEPGTNQNTKITPNRIKKVVCNYYNITKKQIESKNRTADIAMARHIAIYLCRELLDMPFKKIGAEFGNRDHSTIISSYDKIRTLSKKDSYQKAIDQIKEKLNVS